MAAMAEERAHRAARGDAEAKRKLMMATLPMVRRVVRYLMRGSQDHEDAVQATMLEVLASTPRLFSESTRMLTENTPPTWSAQLT